MEDLRDAYTGSLEETILTEVVANALDSGATRVRLLTDAVNATLTVIDDVGRFGVTIRGVAKVRPTFTDWPRGVCFVLSTSPPSTAAIHSETQTPTWDGVMRPLSRRGEQCFS
jgi:hypothetical protein